MPFISFYENLQGEIPYQEYVLDRHLNPQCYQVTLLKYLNEIVLKESAFQRAANNINTQQCSLLIK